MSSKIFKLSSVTLAVATSFGVNAAIYKVVEIDESLNDTYSLGGYTTEYYGTAVEQGAGPDPTLGCFGGTCADSDFKIAAETRNWKEGISYREEVPFAMDNAFNYVDDQADFESYCNAQLRYADCDTWSTDEWNGYAKELSSNYLNSIAFVEGETAAVSTTNAVINSLDGTDPVGNKRDGNTRNVAFVGASDLTLPSDDPTGVVQTRAWKTDGTYTVGSISRKQDNANGSHFYSQAAIWDSSDSLEIGFGDGGATIDSDVLGQASIRDFRVDGNLFYAVGYNTYTDQRMDATVFVGDMSAAPTDVTKWSFSSDDAKGTGIKSVANATSGSDYIYSNSVVSSINDNFVAVGSAKRAGDKPENRAASNRLFYIADVKSSPTATYFSGGIFFDGAGGTMGGINNFNEVVGSVDISSSAEVDGVERAKRAFINPLNATDTNSTRRSSIFNSKAWILDDLTNDGSVSTNNNQYRIIDAADINDAGVIAATALKCTNGYDTTEVDSYCQGGAIGVEKVVAVKLVPIAGSGKDDIQARSFRTETVERKGSSLGFLALTLLAFLGFRRK
ncbi:DUF3466 family protein [Vibrio sp. Isolate25]|uniref:DUF3466 family protein n=1 Tax=Vibrio sp. Isolate25 TaxID=2908535 RepID=UPI001EFC4EA1|nr:DUF3466 family protein [Vibrio sp. Isolate25]MCG9597433.1 DUF3466 family protein [Vibrio sp. Isolate25]